MIYQNILSKFLPGIFLLIICSPGVLSQETNSLGMKMIRVEPGSFDMGSPNGETLLSCDSWDEKPVHKVMISRSFLMSATEVTNAQYEKFDPDHSKWRGLRGVSNGDHEAVTYVSWYDAMAFCRWLSEKEGKYYRLPTEAEWEYACRAGTQTPFWTGEELPNEHHRNQWIETADTTLNKKDEGLYSLKGNVPISLKVGTMPPNPWGIHEMHGGVEEWVLDWYGPYRKGTQEDNGGPPDGAFKVTRGGSHNTALKFLRSANRSADLPGDKNWIIGFRVVEGEMPGPAPGVAVSMDMNDGTVCQKPARWETNGEDPEFFGPVPFVKPDTDHPLLSGLPHHHHPTITWCENGDLLAAWFNTISEKGREMVILSSRLRYKDDNWVDQWDTSRIFFDPADRNTTGSCLVNDGFGRIYYFNSVSESGHHRDQCLMMSISKDNGSTWTRPRIISNLYDRGKITVQSSALVEEKGNKLIIGVDYAPVGYKAANNGGSGIIITEDQGRSWVDQVHGKSMPEVGPRQTDELAAGFHINLVRLKDNRILAMARHKEGLSDIGGHTVMSYSRDEGKTWNYRESPFPNIGSGQRLVLMRLNEGPLMFVSFENNCIYAALSRDEGKTWPVKKKLADLSKGYMAATQTPDNNIHLITSREYFRFNLAWILDQPDKKKQ